MAQAAVFGRAPALNRPGRWARPAGGLVRARWYYLMFVLVVGVSCVPPIVLGAHTGSWWKAAGLAGLAGVLAARVWEYRRDRLLPLWAEAPQALALVAAASTAGPLTSGLGLFFTGCFFRALYGSTRRTVAATVGWIALLGLAASIGPGANWQGQFVSQAFGIATATLLTRLLLGTLLAQNQAVVDNERLLAAVFDNLDVSVIVGGAVGSPALMNRAARLQAAALGLPAAPAAWHGAAEVYEADGVTRVAAQDMPDARARRGESVREQGLVFGAPTGARRSFAVNADPLPAEAGPAGVVVTISDVTARLAAEAELSHLALHDPLTGLGNRTLLTQAMTGWLARSTAPEVGLAVVLLDLDGFKNVNDSLGHACGDEVLKVIAGRLAAAVRTGDVIARLGGDEFAVLVTGRQLAGELADRVCEVVSEPVDVRHTRVSLTTSVGIAYLAPGQSPDDALAAADLAMYAAKGAGPGRVQLFAPAMRAALDQRLALEAELHHALEHGEFELHYQSYVHLETGDVIGAEALVRWRSPTRGLVPPIEFIPIVEDNAMIVPLGRWILFTACAAAAGWQPADPARVLSVSVNVSGRQLAEAGFLADVAQALADSDLPPAALTVEITESVFVDQGPELLDTLASLKTLGVRIAVDDFGTGYSSLSRLQTFPVDILKVDQSFVSKIDDSQGHALVAAVLAMAAALMLDVVAEGVETPAQAAALSALGCRVAQGYLYSRPAPPPLPGLTRPAVPHQPSSSERP